jgi:hypothetical protein
MKQLHDQMQSLGLEQEFSLLRLAERELFTADVVIDSRAKMGQSDAFTKRKIM